MATAAAAGALRFGAPAAAARVRALALAAPASGG